MSSFLASIAPKRTASLHRASDKWSRRRAARAVFLLSCLFTASVACTPTEAEFSAEKERESREFMERARSAPGGGMTGRGMMMGPGLGVMGAERRGGLNLTRGEVEVYFADYLAQQGDGSNRVGKVEETPQGTFIVDVVTPEGAPVGRYEVDRYTGLMREAR